MVATLLVTGQTGQKSFKGILKPFKIRASQMRDVTKRRITLRTDGEPGVRAAYISNYESHGGHSQLLHTGNHGNCASASLQISKLGSPLFLKQLYAFCYAPMAHA